MSSKKATKKAVPKKNTAAPKNKKAPAATALQLRGIKRKSTIDTLLRYLIVFIIPVITFLMIYKQKKIAPFGENSILSVDMWQQYFPFYEQSGRTKNFSDSMYSFTGALGYNNFVQSAFYTRSMFVWIYKLIPFGSTINFLNWLCLFKVGLSAVTCLMLLEYKHKQKSPLLLAVSVCYSLCAYAVAFMVQIMWTDICFLAPLLLIGLEMLIEGKSPLMYVAVLTVTICTNFYLGFGVCLFAGFYFVMEMIKRVKYDGEGKGLGRFSNRRELGAASVKFALYSLLGGLMNAVIILPTLKGLSHSLSANDKKVNFKEWYHTFADNASYMLPMTPISLVFGVANISTGLIMFLLIPLYFMNTKVSFREKLASGGFLGILYAGLNYNPLDYVFNGFHFANQLPGRWSFLFSLAIVITAAEGVAKFRGIKPRSVISAWIIGVFFVLFTKYGSITPQKKDKLGSWTRFLTICAVLILVYAVFKVLAERKGNADEALAEEEALSSDKSDSGSSTIKIKKKAVFRAVSACSSVVLAVLITWECCSNAYTVATKVDGGISCSNSKSYNSVSGVIREFSEKYDCGDKDFYRSESNLKWTYNDGALGGYNAITYYGSTLNGDVKRLLDFFGGGTYAKNVSTVYVNNSPVLNSILDIRYFIDRSKNMNSNVPWLETMENTDDYIIWKNPTALSLAFGVAPSVYNFEVTEEIRPIKAQNDLINMMTANFVNVFEPFKPTSFTGSNALLDLKESWAECFYYRESNEQEVRFEYVFNAPSDDPVFLEHNFRAGSLTVEAQGRTIDVNAGRESSAYIGTFPAGTEIRVIFHSDNVNIGCFGLEMYTLNKEKWDSVYKLLSGSCMEISSFKSTDIKGTINMSSSGTVFTSIPQDGGWSVYADGKKVKTKKIGGALVGFDLEGGEHKIRFKYHCPGFASGLAVSLTALLAAVFCIAYRKKYYARRALKSTAPKPDETEGTKE